MWQIPDTFVASPLETAPTAPANPWGQPLAPKSVIPAPVIDDADNKKRLFAVELSRINNPFQAACNVCGNNTNEALWISKNWVNDPQVLGYKDTYLNSVETSKTLLDKEELSAKFLNMAEEKAANGMFYLLEGKDRLKALELYAKIQGYLDSKDKTPTNFIHNQMIVKFVKPEVKEEKVINHSANDVELPTNIKPLKVKLIG